MRLFTTLIAIAVLSCQLMAPAWAETAFNPTTMLGWQKRSPGAAMAYFRLPLHEIRNGGLQPRLGLMITGPTVAPAGARELHLNAQRVLDLGITGRGIDQPWMASLAVGGATAWASNPGALPKEARTHLMEGSGLTWVAVGLVSVGIVAGVFAMVEKDASAPSN